MTARRSESSVQPEQPQSACPSSVQLEQPQSVCPRKATVRRMHSRDATSHKAEPGLQTRYLPSYALITVLLRQDVQTWND